MFQPSRCLALTTINPPNAIMRELAAGARRENIHFFIAGDTKSPSGFALDGATFLNISDQEDRFPEFAALLPTKHYARKNVAYLAAMQTGCEWIQETDDDNLPLDGFWEPIPLEVDVEVMHHSSGWVNAYAPFSKSLIWPRGFPLTLIQTAAPLETQGTATLTGRIRQGLADANPDVDAVYRLAHTLPFHFDKREPIMPAIGQWCPFNSQNTLFHRDVFALLYLPSYCSFRMTDIWRSFVAQRCLWELGENTVFHQPTVMQERNEHDLLLDFQDEIPGYLNNQKICRTLTELHLGGKSLPDQLFACYTAMVSIGVIPEKELSLLQLWIAQVDSASRFILPQ